FAAAAVLALLLAFHKTLSGVIAGIGGAVGSLMTLAAGGVVLIDGQSVDTLIPLIHHAVELTPLNAIWLITFGLCGLFISLFNIDWHRHQHTKANGLLVNLLMAAAVCTVVASNLGALVVMAEIMALCGVFLTGCSASGKLWFALGRLGTLLLALACWLVWQRFGTLDFAALNGQPLGNDVWLLSVVGFGLLAGIIPLHGWVPQAHANASAPAAALFSTVVMKVGLFGILTITLTGDRPPLWWGVALLIAGMITAFVGGLYALMEHNIQRLLAYHTLENIGIILLGMGAGVTGLALNQPALIAAGFIGGLYHLINHSLFKSTLFLGAGSVWFRTGHRDIEKLGGIGKKMPVISLAMLVGLMAMAALPPLNGFAGEWVIYQSFFALGQSEAFIGRLLGPLLAVLLMFIWANDFHAIFWVAVIPAVLSILLLGFGLQEPKSAIAHKRSNPLKRENLKKLSAAYWWVVAIGSIFTLARFSEAFLVLRAQQMEIPLYTIPLVMVAMNLVYSLTAYPFGKLSD
ncbi:formate hydrogenlyase subunit 3, partial [Enterobacter cloacae complex sp. GF14B]|uniref:formate hydrogenlyase subunit 3 n=1 Tax=Enterobacter cloacae complex sp. GF14B TaxID=2511982 RepID=UPI002102531E